jgi:hypothetical protein
MNNNLTKSLAKYYLSSRGQVSTVGHSFDSGVGSLSLLNATRTANKLIAHFFSPINALASKPVYTVTADSVIIYVFYYIPLAGQGLNNNTVNNLGEALSGLFSSITPASVFDKKRSARSVLPFFFDEKKNKREKAVELRLVKLHYPYLNSYILAQYIASNAQNYKLAKILRRLFSYVAPVKNTSRIFSENTQLEALSSVLPSHIVGLKVRVSGRLTTERSRPRQTVQTAEIGSFSKSNLSLVDTDSFTTNNKKGAFTVKVWISQRAVGK